MSEEQREISVSEFMGGISEAGRISSETKSQDFNGPPSPVHEESLIVPVEELEEEDREAVRKELEKQEAQQDIGELEIRSLIGVIPLEPVIVMASLGASERLGDLKSVGIPGYINPNSGEFFLLDGSVPNSATLREKVKEYVENR